ncbi:MAG TPA: cation transporter [Gaiellaceae bacterium]
MSRPLITTAIRLSAVTIGWNVAAAGLAIGAWVISGNLALGGFGLNAVIDSSASVVLIWRFSKDRDNPSAAARLERRAEIAISYAMFGVATFLVVEALHAITAHSHPDSSVVGLGVTIASLLFLPWLSRAKARVARDIPSRALRADAILTGASAALAALTLGALAADSAFGWWWADAAAALAIAMVLAAEVLRSAKARSADG